MATMMTTLLTLEGTLKMIYHWTVKMDLHRKRKTSSRMIWAPRMTMPEAPMRLRKKVKTVLMRMVPRHPEGLFRSTLDSTMAIEIV
jgi:hypothetical protein